MTWLADKVGAERTSFTKKLGGQRALSVDDVWHCANALEIPVADLLAAGRLQPAA
jgi:hypothetical protein